MFRVVPARSLALDQGFGRLLEGLDLGTPTLGDRIIAVALYLPAGAERPLACIGQADLGIGA